MKAMILAAGLGQRMRPLTLTTPKPLLLVAGKSLIVYQIENLCRAGIRDIVINHAWLGEQIEEALGDGSQYGCSIKYSAETEPLETAGGIANALHLLADDQDAPFMLVNGDVFTKAEYADLDLTLSSDRNAKLWLIDNPEWHLQGDFGLVSGEVVDDAATKMTFSGISLMRPSLFKSIKPGTKAALAPLLRQAMMLRQVSGEPLNGYWNDVGTPERLVDVEKYIQECV